jgi:hypothetical protein
LLLAAVLAPLPARAEDGLYGRFDGDVVITGGLGAGVATARPRAGMLSAEIETLYLDSAGLIATAERVGDTLGMTVGAKLRPLFLARFFGNLWTGSSFVDLLIDSLGLELGSWVGPLDRGTGAALWLGTGIEVPLSRQRRGFHLRFSARYVHTWEQDLAAPQAAPKGLRVLASIVYAGVMDWGLATRESLRRRP